MIEVVSDGPFSAAALLWQRRRGETVCTIVVKATYALAPVRCELVEDPRPIARSDEPFDDAASSSLARPTDLVPFKLHPEVLVTGSAFAPRSTASSSVVVRVAVGSMDKVLEAHAPRFFTRDGDLDASARAARFSLRWEAASGGRGTDNPVGLDLETPDARSRLPVPSITPPQHRLTRPSDFVPIVGLGPFAPAWPPRARRLRSEDQAWLADPLARPLPAGFDAAFFQSAPEDQWLEEPIRSSERLLLEGLHAQHPRLATNLSGLEPRAVLVGIREESSPLLADTLLIDTDRGEASVVWRGQIAFDGKVPSFQVVILPAGPEGDDPSHHERTAPSRRLDARLGAVVAQQARIFADPMTESVETTNTDDVQLAPTALPFAGRKVPPRPPLPSQPDGVLPFRNGDGVDEITADTEPPGTGSMRLQPPPVGSGAPPARPSSPPARPSSPPARPSVPPAPPPTSSRTAPPPPPPARVSATPSAPPVAPLAILGSGGVPLASSPAPSTPSPPLVAPPAPLASIASPTLPASIPSATPSSPSRPGPAPTIGTLAAAASAAARLDAPPSLGTAALPVSSPVFASAAEPKRAVEAPVASGETVLGGARAVSDAAATREQRRDGSRPVPPPNASSAGTRPLTPQLATDAPRRQALVDLLAFDPALPERMRREPAVIKLLGAVTSRPSWRRTDEAPDDDAQRAERGRLDVLRLLSFAAPMELSKLREATGSALEDPAQLELPLVVVTGELRPTFDDLEALKMAIQVAQPLAGASKTLAQALKLATDAVSSSWPPTGEAAVTLLRQLDQASASVPQLPARYLASQVERALVEQRRYRRRVVLGEPRLRAELAIGRGDGVPIYLPESIAERLPMLASFPIVAAVELRPREDGAEASPDALLALAVARVVRTAEPR